MDYFLLVSLLCWFYLLSNVICDDIHNGPLTSQEYESNMSLMEEQIIRNDFVCVNRSNKMEFHEVVIAIQQKNLPFIKQMVLDRANPLNPSYQQWMTFNEIGELVENLESYSRVIDWLNAYNLSPSWHSTYHEYVKVNSTIETLEQMLSTEFYACHDHSRSFHRNLTFHRSFRYSIPTILINDIHAIFHTSQVPPRYEPSFQIPSNSWKLGNTQNVTISFLNNLYQISSNIAESSFNQSSYQMSNEYFSQSDLQQFQQTYQLTVQPAISIGGHDTSTCTTTTCPEGNLDIQYMMGIAQKAATIFWYVASDTGDPFVSWITTVSSLDNPPQSNTISWNSLEMFISDAVLTSWEAEAMKLSGRGVTISTASGDHGAPNSYDNECLCVGTSPPNFPQENDGYNPYFPASSQWVTAVGGTMGPESGQTEIACQSSQGGIITSGGGFSEKVLQPSYQSDAIDQYLSQVQSLIEPGYHTGGRAYPDISLISVFYEVVIGGMEYALFGTSCSTPVFAAMVTLTNSIRAHSNKPPIGFINPTLYSVGKSNPSLFNDISTGVNNCCAAKFPANPTCCSTGFSAAKGWDPVTGWGSVTLPNFLRMFG